MRLATALTTLLTLAGVPPSAAPPPAPAAVRIEMREFAFHPAVIRLQAGAPVRLRLDNRGQIAHQFETDYTRDAGVRVVDAVLDVTTMGLAVIRLEPGTTASLEFLPRRRGRFPFACTIEGHLRCVRRAVTSARPGWPGRVNAAQSS